MSLLWPGFLALMVLIPLLIAVYIWLMRRRRRFTVRYSSLSLIRDALPRYSQIRRHLPFALFVIGLGSLIIALGRPIAIVASPADETVILLTIDVSRSMCSTDVSPSRILAAQAAALTFIHNQKPGTQIGIVAFSSFAELIQAPTTDQTALQNAIESLATGRRTAIGSAILKSLDAIAEIDKNVAPSVSDPAADVSPVPQGAYVPDIIVLLTDGSNNTGPLPMIGAQEAANRGVRVYTIGFGTLQGSEFPNCPSQFYGSEPGGGPGGGAGPQFNRTPAPGGFGGGQGGGGFGGPGGFRRGIDEATLKQVAALTGATYHPAQTAGQLQDVFQSLPTNLIMKNDVTEISVGFTAIGALFAALAVFLSISWQPFP
jgi:Ca-activated chloride channel family protein